MLNELDKELERRGHKYVRYADDCLILCKSKEKRREDNGKHCAIHHRKTVSESQSSENDSEPRQQDKIPGLRLLPA